MLRKILIRLMLSSLILNPLIFASDLSNDYLPSFKKGFLLPPKPVKPSVKKILAVNPIISSMSTDTKNTNFKNLWLDSRFYTKESRQKLYNYLPEMDVATNYLENQFSKLFSKNWFDKAQVCHNQEFITFFIAVKRLFEDQRFYQDRTFVAQTDDKTNPLPFIMQIMGHQILASYFHFMESLPSAQEKEDFKKTFITTQSDSQQGEIILDKNLWQKLTDNFPIPKVRYFADNVGINAPNYHFYFKALSGLIASAHPIINQDNFSWQGGLELVEYTPEGYIDSAGFILDKNHLLYQKDALIFSKREYPEEAQLFLPKIHKKYELLLYTRHLIFDQMFFFEIGSIENEKQIEPWLEFFVELAGGIEKINRDKFIVIPIPDPNIDIMITPSFARAILPLLSALYEEDKNNNDPRQIDWIENTMEELTDIVAEDMIVNDKTFNEDFVANIISDEIKSELNNKDSDLAKRIQVEKKSLRISQKKDAKRRQQFFNKARKKVIAEVKKEKAQALNHDVIKQRKKQKALEQIKEAYRKKISLTRHFSSQEVKELLGEMVDDFAKYGIQKTGNIQVNGSHTALQVRDENSGNQTWLLIARRNQKAGYSSGTVRTILGNIIKKVSLIIGNKDKK